MKANHARRRGACPWAAVPPTQTLLHLLTLLAPCPECTGMLPAAPARLSCAVLLISSLMAAVCSELLVWGSSSQADCRCSFTASPPPHTCFCWLRCNSTDFALAFQRSYSGSCSARFGLRSEPAPPSSTLHSLMCSVCTTAAHSLHTAHSCAVSTAEGCLEGSASEGSPSSWPVAVIPLSPQPFIRCSLQCRDLVDEAKKFHLRPELRSQMQGPRTRARLGEQQRTGH